MMRRIALAALVVAAVLASAAACPPPRHDVPASCVQSPGVQSTAQDAMPAGSTVPAGQPSPYPHAWEVCPK